MLPRALQHAPTHYNTTQCTTLPHTHKIEDTDDDHVWRDRWWWWHAQMVTHTDDDTYRWWHTQMMTHTDDDHPWCQGRDSFEVRKHCNTLWHTARHHKTLQHAVTHRKTPQDTARHCVKSENLLQYLHPCATVWIRRAAVCRHLRAAKQCLESTTNYLQLHTPLSCLSVFVCAHMCVYVRVFVCVCACA